MNKKLKKYLNTRTGFAAAIVLAAVIICYAYFCTHQNVGFFGKHKEVIPYTEGWMLECSSGVYNISLPSRDEYDNTSEKVKLSNVLPPEIASGTVLLTRTSLQEISVFVGGEEAYSYGSEKYRAFGKNNGSIWNIVRLSESDAGKSIEIELNSPYKTYRSTFNACYLGTEDAVFGFLFYKYGFSFALIIVIFVISMALLGYYFFLKYTKINTSSKPLLVALLGIFSAIWLFSECKLTQVLVGNMAGFSNTNFLVMAIVLIPGMMYVDLLEKKYYHQMYSFVISIMEINVFVQTILQLLGIADYYEMMTVTHILMVLGAALCILTAIQRFIKHRESNILVLLGVASILSIAAIVEMILTYSTGYVSGGIVEFAMLFTIVAAGADSVKEAELLLQKSRRAVADNMAKNTFLASMSHELRTPMNAILAMSDLLVHADDMSKNNHDFAKIIHSSSENLLNIVNDILEYSKMSSGKYEITEKEYNIGEFITGVKDIIGIKAFEKGLNFEIHVSPDLPVSVVGDEGRVRQILINLLGNAVKYTDAGKITLNVWSENIHGNKMRMFFAVSDTGIGIKKENQGRLFEAFERTSDAIETGREGTGLGLAISGVLTRLMDGNISFESEYGRGSVFTASVVQRKCESDSFSKVFATYNEKNESVSIYLTEAAYEFTNNLKSTFKSAGLKYTLIKREKVENYDFGTGKGILFACAKAHPVVLSENFHTRYPLIQVVALTDCCETCYVSAACDICRAPFTICDLYKTLYRKDSEKEELPFTVSWASVMVVDDNTINLKVMKEILGRYGIKPTLVSHGEQAVAAYRNKHFDVVFMDQVMPGMDGFETAAEIMNIAQGEGKLVKIVAFTANDLSGEEQNFSETGYFGYLSKPVTMSSVGHMLLKLLPREAIHTEN